MIKTVKIFNSGSDLLYQIANCIRERLSTENFCITYNDKADLMISIGGDETFLKTLKETDFDIDPLYVGVLSGHLGFLQEINLDKIDVFIESIKAENYKIEELSILNTRITTDGHTYKLKALNESSNMGKKQLRVDRRQVRRCPHRRAVELRQAS